MTIFKPHDSLFIKTTVFVVGIVALLAPGTAHSAKQTGSAPNIILILSDDAGYADYGFQGSEHIRTPNLDRLAEQSVEFTQAYTSAAVCGPSRAGLMTGKYQQQFGFWQNNVPGAMSEKSGLNGARMGLPTSQTTMASYLSDLGYHSIALGKWHLGGMDRFHPMRRGFDEFFGFRGGARSYWPYEEAPKREMKRLERGFNEYKEHEGYLTDALGQRATEFIRDNQERPFFIYLAFNAPHTPMHAREQDLSKFPKLQGPRKVYAAMMLAMDRAIGNVLDTLKETGVKDNTIVVYTNDNGGPTDANSSSNLPLSGIKGTHLEGGFRVPYLIRWPGELEGDTTYDKPVSTLDLLPTVVSAAGGEVAAMNDIDGEDLRPYLQGSKEGRPHNKLYWRVDVRAAARMGDWKLIRLPDRPAQLYNLAEDPYEMQNVADAHPKKLRELYKGLFEWELQHTPPLWQLKTKYLRSGMRRFDRFKRPHEDLKR
jgi:arylsulfatase A-like enzyme